MTGKLEGLIVDCGRLDMEHGRCPAGKMEGTGWEIFELEGLGAGDERAEDMYWTADRELR